MFYCRFFRYDIGIWILCYIDVGDCYDDNVIVHECSWRMSLYTVNCLVCYFCFGDSNRVGCGVVSGWISESIIHGLMPCNVTFGLFRWRILSPKLFIWFSLKYVFAFKWKEDHPPSTFAILFEISSFWWQTVPSSTCPLLIVNGKLALFRMEGNIVKSFNG